MRPPLTACVLLAVIVAAAAAAPRASAVCVPRKPGAPVKPRPKPTPAPARAPAPPKPKPPAPVAPGGDIVKALCAKTDYPALCLASIARQRQRQQPPPPPPGKKLDGAAVLRLEMGAVRAKGAEARKAAGALAADPRTPRLALGPLVDCLDSYDDIGYSLDQVDKAMAAGDKDTAGTMLDTVGTDVDTCDQGFEDRPELAPLMSKYDSELTKLASNCLAIATAAGLI